MGTGTTNQVPYYAADGGVLSATSSITILSNGNVGIGTTTPGSLLSIGGTGTGWNFFDNATTTKGGVGGINIKQGCFAINGTCVGGAAASLTGTTGQLAYFNGTNIAVGTSTLFLSTEGNIGIGTTTPWAQLSINPSNISGPSLVIGSSTATSLIVTNGGNVGIGTLSPSAKLDITGTNSIATIGSEMISATADRDFSSDTGKWTGTNWSVGSGVITHTAGANALTLDNTALSSAPVAGNTYQVTFTLNTTAVGTVLVNIGGTNVPLFIGQATGVDTEVQVVTVTGSSPLTFTPSAAWTGTIDDVSIKQVTLSSPTQVVRNSNGTIGFELRAGGSALSNMFFGTNSGQSNTTGTNNIAFGSNNLPFNTTGFRNVAIGVQVLANNTTGSSNTAIGSIQTLFSNTSGSNNVAIGQKALVVNTIGSSNVAVGDNSAFTMNTGSFNTAIGVSALGRPNSSNNTAVGYKAGFGSSNGSVNSNNSFFGYQSGLNLTTGSNNVLLGYQAGSNLTTGSGNVILGYNISATSSTATNSLNIGNLIFGTGLDGSGTTLSTGNIGIGTTTPWRTLSVAGTVALNGLTSSATGNALCITTTKDITDAGGASCVPSSIRFKENIETLVDGFALDELNKLRVVSFDYKPGFYSTEDAKGSYGLIAEEVADIDTKLVDYGYDGQPLTLKFEKLTGLAIQAIQELSKTVRGFASSITTTVLNATDINGQKLCLGSTCLTEAQLQAIINQSGQQAASSPPPTPAPEPPVEEPPSAEVPPSPEAPAPLDEPVSTSPVEIGIEEPAT